MKRRAGVIFINSLSTYARMGAGMVLSLLITRSTLDVLTENSATPKEIFGIFMLLTSISTACQFLNDSTSKALVRFLSISLQEGDSNQIRRYFNSGWVMSVGIGAAIALVLAIAAPWLVKTFSIPESLITPALYVVWFSALIQVLNAMSQPWFSALGAQDRYSLINFQAILQQFLTFICLRLFSLLPFDPLINLSLVWLLPNTITNLLPVIWLWIQQPIWRLNFRFVQWKDCKQLFSLGGWSSLITFATSLYERTDQILINLLLGPASNALYSVVIQIGNAIARLVTALTTVLLPTASKIASKGTPWEKQQLIIRATRYVLTLAMPSAIAVAVFRQEIVELWLGKGFEGAIAILPLAMLLVFSRIPVFVTWPYLTAANQLKLPALAMLFDGIINIILSIFYVKAFNLGLAGIVLGTLSTNLIRFICFQIPFVARLVELPVMQYWQQGYGRPAVAMLWFAPALLMIQGLNLSTPIEILLIAFTVVLYIAWVWFRVFDGYEQKLFLDLIRSIQRKVMPESR